MENQWIRTELLLGEEAVEQLKKSHVAVFGVGGVGGYVVEALARTGVGTFDLIDRDTVSVSNINRQIIATHISASFCRKMQGSLISAVILMLWMQ